MRFLCMMLATLSLLGCGFHLRGTADVPVWLNKVFIINEHASRETAMDLAKNLDGLGITVVTNPKLADYILVLKRDNVSRNLISIAASNGPRQFKLTYRLEYSYQARRKKPVVVIQAVSVDRIYTENSNTILGSTYEQQQFVKTMHQSAINQMLTRINMTHVPERHP